MTAGELAEDREPAITTMAVTLLADLVLELASPIPPDHLPRFCEGLSGHRRHRLEHAYRLGAGDAPDDAQARKGA
ncbi:MAG: hypothetical protein C0501_21265 [Isosphaera sp.]|nr:hypothetical protein [Isosphaera sp.]